MSAVNFLQFPDQCGLIVKRAYQTLTQPTFTKHLLPKVEILLGNLHDRHSLRQRRRDDRAGGRAGDQIEIVSQAKIFSSAMPLSEQRLDLGEIR